MKCIMRRTISAVGSGGSRLAASWVSAGPSIGFKFVSSLPAAAKAVRPMGWLEQNCHRVPNCSATSSSFIEGCAMDPALFTQAVRAVTRRHPMLHSVIDQERFGFVELEDFEPGLDHCQVIEGAGADDWKAIADEVSNTPYDMYASPLWRFRLVKSGKTNVLVISLHHTVMDGTSLYRLTHDILRFYQRLVELGDVGDIDPLPLLPSPDSMLLDDGAGPAGNKAAVNALVEDLARRRCEWKPALQFDRSAGAKHNSTLYSDGCAENALALRARCHSKGLTVGAAQSACILFTLAKMDHDFRQTFITEPSAKSFYDLDMDVNLRNRLKENLGDDHVGAIISILNIAVPLSGETKFWDFVAQVKANMNESMDSERHLHFLEAAKQFERVSADMPAFQEKLKHNHGHAQEINFSNFTKYSHGTNYGDLKLTRLYVSGGGCSPTFASCVFWTATVTTNHYSFLYATSDLNTKLAQTFFKQVVDLIEKSHTLDDDFSLLDWLSV